MTTRSNTVQEAIRTRQSTRRFRSEPVSREQVERVLELARWAPSNGNTQPWRVYVVTGELKARIGSAVQAAAIAGKESPREYRFYPDEWWEPLQSRRRACGWGLYESLGIRKGDREATAQQNLRNFTWFDAPVGLCLTLDRRLGRGSWVDLGAFLQTICLAAHAEGLDSCPQAAFSSFHDVLREHLEITDQEIFVCGVALGHGDTEAPENVWRADRAPVGEFASWHGW